jgi:hypothetical protein
LEIGGGSGTLALLYTENTCQKWAIIEPTPSFSGNQNIRVIKDFFNEKTSLAGIDTVVHSG